MQFKAENSWTHWLLQSVTWSNVGFHLCPHMASLGPNESMGILQVYRQSPTSAVQVQFPWKDCKMYVDAKHIPKLFTNHSFGIQTAKQNKSTACWKVLPYASIDETIALSTYLPNYCLLPKKLKATYEWRCLSVSLYFCLFIHLFVRCLHNVHQTIIRLTWNFVIDYDTPQDWLPWKNPSLNPHAGLTLTLI